MLTRGEKSPAENLSDAQAITPPPNLLQPLLRFRCLDFPSFLRAEKLKARAFPVSWCGETLPDPFWNCNF
ncbi:hypothetical protein MLD38_005746 [Melastoma candidum]|uniref:Uncharacterized protein n=1 Tax=Melastoma candidum TaxID=119954 RepID=A0ACB9RKM4_9MYRT|nr:hypothetical protein MLD38_005746 [Melastoma candidum]